MSDPAAQTYRNARREARFVLSVWFCALVWTVGYCYLHGYPHAPDSWLVCNGLADTNNPAILSRTLGMPSWVFWGIVVPAAVCSVVTLAFGLFGMRDDPLGADQEPEA
jgi:hypothetical protein